MSTSPLKSLTIQHLRGAVAPFTLTFEPKKALTVIYGENGTGKTTICDAIEFLGRGKVGSLENRGLGRPAPFWPSLGRSNSDISVRLDAGDGACAGVVQKSDVVVTPAASRPRVEVLRRSQILELVQAAPAERYKSIRRFIDVSGVEASEKALRDLIGDLNKSREVAVARVQENLSTLERAWANAGSPAPDALTWARGEAQLDDTAALEELAAVVALRGAHAKLADLPTKLKRAADGLEAATAALSEAERQLNECLASVAGDAEQLVGILEAAKDYLAVRPDPAECPLCGSAERVEGLAGRVEATIQQFTALRTARKAKSTAEASVRTATRESQQAVAEATSLATAFGTTRASHTWPTDITLPSTACPSTALDLAAWLAATAPLAEAWAEAESKRRDSSQVLKNLRGALKAYQDNVREQEELDQLLPRLQRALEIMEEERRKFTDEILAGIATQVGRLYEAVHPGEGLNRISLQLDPEQRASLDIGTEFCGSAVPPQAYFSDSHLDTLGLCVFFALAALDDPAGTILVLDDVLGSVDEPHVDRLIEMLYAEASRFRHCILTTHYKPWKQKLRWGWLRNGQCQFVELSKWSASGGLTLIRSVPDVEKLRHLLAEDPPDPQLVCAKAGVVLEAVLEFLTLQYECAVPRKAGDLYTLGDLLPNVNRKLRGALRVEVLVPATDAEPASYRTVALGPFLDELERIAQLRNVFGCHFNKLSFELLDADAIGFGQQVLAMVEALTDDEAGWPRSDKSGSYWATGGETRRLHPLKKPA